MCEYEKTCTEKPVKAILRRNMLIKEEVVCERNTISCETYRGQRLCARSHAHAVIGQVRLYSYGIT